jgi:O-acetyl-ADP-ribose deacetylase (regulator of RNase III)
MNVIIGDLITAVKKGDIDVIVHGCNCFCTMGAGIAKQIKKEFPAAYEEDMKTRVGDKNKIGTVTYAAFTRTDGSVFWVVNAYTQYGYGKGRIHTDYEALQWCFTRIKSMFHGRKIGYPLIGCGLGGGDRHTVLQIIERTLIGEDHTLFLLK